MDNNEYTNAPDIQSPQQGYAQSPPPQSQQQYTPPPQRALSPQVAERRLFKGRVEYMSVGLLIYSFIITVVVIADMFAHYIFFAITSSGNDDYKQKIEEYTETFTDSAGSMLAGVLIGVVFLMLFFIKALPVKEIFKPHSKMKITTLFMLIVVLMGVQIPFMLIDPCVEWMFNLFGLTIQDAIDSATAGSKTLSMFLYASFIGPIVEEIVYRGFAMHGLQRAGCGKVTAMVLSSMLFGIMHANPTQSVFAFFVGLVFSYAAIEYGIGWSILLHITNNFVFGDLLVFITKPIPDKIDTILEYALFGAFTLGGIIILICKRKYLANYVRENNSPAKHYGWAFSCIAFLLFILGNAGLATLQIRMLK